jgi:hypothetical protein
VQIVEAEAFVAQWRDFKLCCLPGGAGVHLHLRGGFSNQVLRPSTRKCSSSSVAVQALDDALGLHSRDLGD